MPVITLITLINTPVEEVFDMARSIDLHQQSMVHTSEKAVAGRTSGLIEAGETVTWEARHFFRTRRLTSAITAMNAPHYFRDVMIEGDFKSLEHDHYFSSSKGVTEMKDVMHFSIPYGFLGTLAEIIFFTGYMKRLLRKRNLVLKLHAEGNGVVKHNFSKV